MKFACSTWLWGFRIWRIKWCPPSLSRDRRWARVTKCTHSRVVDLRLEGKSLFTHTLGQQPKWTNQWRLYTGGVGPDFGPKPKMTIVEIRHHLPPVAESHPTDGVGLAAGGQSASRSWLTSLPRMAVIEWGPAAAVARDDGVKLGSCPSLLHT